MELTQPAAYVVALWEQAGGLVLLVTLADFEERYD